MDQCSIDTTPHERWWLLLTYRPGHDPTLEVEFRRTQVLTGQVLGNQDLTIPIKSHWAGRIYRHEV